MNKDELAILQARLRPRLTEEFLATLVEAARIDGWMTDYIEIAQFVTHVFQMAGKEAPDLQPYSLD